MPVLEPSALAQSLLAWYDRAGRDLPWRKKYGEVADPYHVWLSEVMLQQTTVVAVAPYFRKFVERWPKVTDLAAAAEDEVMHAWAGLGYYARARNLHACAKVVASWRDGRFPDDEESLRKLPGIGDYTAAAITAIAFGKRAVVMDGNVERVIARLFAVPDPLPGVKPHLKALAGQLTPDFRPGDYAQAVMDLGATICTPRNPACVLCPWLNACEGNRQGIAATLPAKLAKPERPTRHGTAFLGHPQGWRRADPSPAAAGSAGRHDGNPLDTLAGKPVGRGRIGGPTTAARPMAPPARLGPPHFHPFSPGA